MYDILPCLIHGIVSWFRNELQSGVIEVRSVFMIGIGISKANFVRMSTSILIYLQQLALYFIALILYV